MADSGCEDTVPTAPAMTPLCKLPEESDASMRARLFTSLSQSFPHSQLYKALHGEVDLILGGNDNGGDSEDDDDSLYGDHLSNSCFASLRMDRRDSDDFDDDLRSLEWLQSEDLLKNIGGDILDREDGDDSPATGEQKENEDVKPDLALLQAASSQQPPHLPYMPHKHVNSKPPYSFSCLIFMAVEASPQKRLPVKDIYNWILTQFPYFQNAPTGWKNSVRHNLSLNKCFKKVEKDKGQSIGKGSLWCIDPAYRPNLLQALRKTPYHPYHQLQMTSTQPQNYMLYQSLPGSGRTVLPLTQRPVPNTVSPHLFPFLSRRLAQTSFDVDNEMKDVAQTLVALKGSIKKETADSTASEDIGPTWRHHKRSYSSASQRRPSSPVIVTDHPSLDHAYSSSRILEDDAPSHSSSSSSSIDEEYDFGDAVLTYLLRHACETADGLFSDLEDTHSQLVEDLLGSHNEECESDYQSDMEWDSDAKDEVDGDLNTSSSSRRGKLKIEVRDDADGDKSTVEDTEDDEQKKLHEGASALLNLAGFLLGQSRDRAGAALPSGDGDAKKANAQQKKRPASKGQGRPKRVEDEDDDKSVGNRPTSKSKRKNAGSNAKYDNDEYSLSKSSKTNAKSRKTLKSPSNKPGRKMSKTVSKAKPAVSHVNNSHKAVKKKGPEPKKLKLSKAFGKKAPNTNGPLETNSKTSKKSGTKNTIVKNGLTKRATAASSKIKTFVDTTSEPEAAASLIALSSPENKEFTSNNDSTKSSKSPDCSSPESDGASALPAHNNNNIDISKSLEASDKSVLPTASGDAPIQLSSESGLPNQREGLITPPPTNITNHNSMAQASHKSPHFTRFSKKKKDALS